MKKIPNYRRIYTDMLLMKYQDKIEQCSSILKKENLSLLDIITLNNMLSNGSANNSIVNQKLRSYDRSAIFKILEYQKKNQLNNSQLAKHFRLSRNTVAKWKKIFSV